MSATIRNAGAKGSLSANHSHWPQADLHPRQGGTRDQGNRITLPVKTLAKAGIQNSEEVGVVPARLLAFASDAGFGSRVLF